MLQVRTTALLANTSEAYARVSRLALKSGSGWRVILQRQEGFAPEEKVSGTGWPCRTSCCTISNALCNGSQCPEAARNPDGLPITLEESASGRLAMTRRG